MKKNRRETRYTSVLIVHVPSVESLIDMMRYDRCVPATEDESRKLWRMLGGETKPSDHLVKFHRFAAANTPATAERWKSFECAVLDERSTDEAQLTDDEIANLWEVHPHRARFGK